MPKISPMACLLLRPLLGPLYPVPKLNTGSGLKTYALCCDAPVGKQGYKPVQPRKRRAAVDWRAYLPTATIACAVHSTSGSLAAINPSSSAAWQWSDNRSIDHGPEFSRLKLVHGPAQGVGHQGRIPENTLVLGAGTIVVMRVGAETVERQQLDLLASDIAQHMDGDAPIRSHRAHLQAKPGIFPASMTAVPRLWVTVSRALSAISQALDSTSGSFCMSRSGAICTANSPYPARANMAGNLLRSCPMVHRSGLPTIVGSEHDTDVLLCRFIMVVGVIVKAVEAQQLRLCRPHDRRPGGTRPDPHQSHLALRPPGYGVPRRPADGTAAQNRCVTAIFVLPISMGSLLDTALATCYPAVHNHVCTIVNGASSVAQVRPGPGEYRALLVSSGGSLSNRKAAARPAVTWA